jgi:hypothetical protein
VANLIEDAFDGVIDTPVSGRSGPGFAWNADAGSDSLLLTGDGRAKPPGPGVGGFTGTFNPDLSASTGAEFEYTASVTAASVSLYDVNNNAVIVAVGPMAFDAPGAPSDTVTLRAYGGSGIGPLAVATGVGFPVTIVATLNDTDLDLVINGGAPIHVDLSSVGLDFFTASNTFYASLGDGGRIDYVRLSDDSTPVVLPPFWTGFVGTQEQP